MEVRSQTRKDLIISEVTQQYDEDLRQFVLKDVRKARKDADGDNFRLGSYGKVIDLTWGETECVGKLLHPVFFAAGTELAGMKRLLVKFFEEIKILSRMKHPNIVEFLGLSYQQDCALPILVMEKMDCSLTQYLSTHKKGSIPQNTALGILLGICKGLVYLHEDIKVAHRDLSSNNILLNHQLHAKIADLGSARVLDKPGGWDSLEKLTAQPGVLDFMPPETLSNNPMYTVSVDVFSFACVIIHLFTHRWPTPDHVEKGKNISEFDRRKKYIVEMGDTYLVPIVKECLDDLSILRPTSRQLMVSLTKETTVHHIQTTSCRNEKIDYTIVFAGVTGAGKSSAGNFFLKKQVFKSKRGLLAVTDESTAEISTICGKKVKIVDTPGFFDGFKSTEENFKELSRAFMLAKDGIHAVAFVMNYNRFTVSCEEALQQLFHFKGIQPYLFVLLTQTDNEGITKVATDKYIKECLSSPKCPQGLKNLMQHVNYRVIMVETVSFVEKNYQKQKRQEFINMVESVFKSNENKMYTNMMLRLAALAYESARKYQAEKIQEAKAQILVNLEKIEQLQKQTSNSAECTDSTARKCEIAKLKKENVKLEKDIEEVQTEEYLQKLTSDYLKKLMKNIKGKNFSDFMRAFAIHLGTSAVVTPVGAGITGIMGSLIGGGVGAAIGTVVPGAGTAIGAVTGAQIGGTLGAMLGGVSVFGSSVKEAYDDCSQQ